MILRSFNKSISYSLSALTFQASAFTVSIASIFTLSVTSTVLEIVSYGVKTLKCTVYLPENETSGSLSKVSP